MARTALTYPRTPLGGVYIPGAKSIEGATGDTARTTTGWVEDEKYGWRFVATSTAVSAEFDTAVTRTGAKTYKVSNTDITGRNYSILTVSTALANLKKYCPRIKPNTTYTFNCWAKTNNAVANSVYIIMYQFTVSGAESNNASTNKLSGTNDWTLLTKTFTTSATAYYFDPEFHNSLAGNISDAWFDVNSMTLTEVLPRTVPTYPRTPLGGVYIPGAKSIEASTGDTARTTSGWIENEKYKWYFLATVAAVSAEFDTTITRTGTKTVKLSNTNTSGRSKLSFAASESLANLQKYCLKIKPSTAYVLNCWVKTTDAKANSVYFDLDQYDDAGVYGTTKTTNKLSGTVDWTLCTVSFTSDADAKYIYLLAYGASSVGNIQDAWFDVNSLTLTEVLPRNPVV